MNKSKKTKIIAVQGTNITILNASLIYNGMRNRNTVKYHGIREQNHPPDFKGSEFETFSDA